MVRNLIWITADQWRGDCLGAKGRRPVSTPNLDALAERAVRFDRHYVQSAPCGPSRASLHTGFYPWVHGSWTNGEPIRPGLGNWALELAAQGFATALVGYTHTSLDPAVTAAERLLPRGFQGVLPGLALAAELTVDMVDWRQWFVTRAGGTPPAPVLAGAANGYEWGQAAFPFQWSETAYLAEAAARFLKARPAQPWALHVTFFRPHDPYIVSSDGVDELPDETGREPFPRAPDDKLADLLAAANPRNCAPEPEDVRALRRHYLASVAEMDRGVGLVLDALRASGADRDTLVVVTSDHGDQLGDHGLMNKLGVYDQTYHVPLVIYLPDAPDETRGRVVDVTTQGIDLVPTLLDCLLGASNDRPGRSLRPWLIGDHPAEWPAEAMWGYQYRPADGTRTPGRLYAARSASHLLALSDDLPPLLIDYASDGEASWRNIAGTAQGRQAEATLRAALARAQVPGA